VLHQTAADVTTSRSG